MPLVEFIANVAVGAIFFIYWIVAFIILYHLTRFGIGTQPKKLAAAFLFGSVALSLVSVILYAAVDISQFLPL